MSESGIPIMATWAEGARQLKRLGPWVPRWRGRHSEPQVTQRTVPDRRRQQPAPAQRALKVEPQRVRIVLRTVAREHGGRRQASAPQRDRDPFAGEGGNHRRLVADPVQPVGGGVIGTEIAIRDARDTRRPRPKQAGVAQTEFQRRCDPSEGAQEPPSSRCHLVGMRRW